MTKQPEWTEGRVKSFITSVIRSGFRKWPSKYEALAAAKVGKMVNKGTGRIAEHYKCAACLSCFPAKDVQVDHVEAVVCPKNGFIDWDVYIKRMYVSADKLQVLCKTCHLVKSNKEKSERKKK